jgi:hypothetical protein
MNIFKEEYIMGFYSDNEIGSLGTVNVEAAEGYSGAIGAQLAMVEGFQNDMAIFTAALKTDIKENRMIREGASEEELCTVQEGALSSFWEKIKTLIKNIIAKVKSIFGGFIAKFEAWMNKDGTAFYNKHKKEIFSGKDLSGLKVRYAKPKLNIASISVDIAKVALKSDLGDVEHSELVESYLGAISHPSTKASAKEFRKEFHSNCFEDEEKDYEVKGDVGELISYISGKSDPIAAIKKMATSQEKGLAATLKQVEKFQKQTVDNAVDGKNDTHDAYANRFGGKGMDGKAPEHKNKFDAGTNYQKRAAGMQKQVSAMQETLNIANSAALTEIKFAVAQSRRIAAAIVAFNPKKHEDTSLLEIEQEAAEYEVLSALEAVC